MPIREVSNRPRIPIAGTIRLGVREESRSGSAYPKTTEYFVLDDAPNVRKVYGDDPKELDIMFPVADPNKVLPTWYKLWTPSLKKGNKIEQGRLLCKGDGPYEGEPGAAEWYDKIREPVSGVIGARDPATGRIKRECWGKSCPDAFDDRGNPKCKQAMQVFCILPRVSFGEVYIINTSSWGSIRSFHDWFIWHLTAFGPKYVTTNYYKIAREEEATRYFDKKENKEKNSIQYIMKLMPQDTKEFEMLYASRLSETKIMFQPGEAAKLLPTSEEADQMAMDEIYPCIDVSKESKPSPLQAAHTRLSKAEALLDDPDVVAAFSAFEAATGKVMDRKTRLMGVRARENEPDMKSAVLLALVVPDTSPSAVLVEVKNEEPPVQEPAVDEMDYGDVVVPPESGISAESTFEERF